MIDKKRFALAAVVYLVVGLSLAWALNFSGLPNYAGNFSHTMAGIEAELTIIIAGILIAAVAFYTALRVYKVGDIDKGRFVVAFLPALIMSGAIGKLGYTLIVTPGSPLFVGTYPLSLISVQVVDAIALVLALYPAIWLYLNVRIGATEKKK